MKHGAIIELHSSLFRSGMNLIWYRPSGPFCSSYKTAAEGLFLHLYFVAEILGDFPVPPRELQPDIISCNMDFNSPIFLFLFLPLFIFFYQIATKQAKPYIGILGSLLFYSWGYLNHIPLMLGLVFFCILSSPWD